MKRLSSINLSLAIICLLCFGEGNGLTTLIILGVWLALSVAWYKSTEMK